MKNLILSLALLLAGIASAVPTNTPTPNATQTPHAVLIDSALIQSGTAGTSPFTLTYTVGTSGVSPAMVVHVFIPSAYTATDFVKTLSYGGVNLAPIQRNRMNYATGVGVPSYVDTFYLLDPPTGSNNLVVTLNVSETVEILVGVSSYFNVWYIANAYGTNTIAKGSISSTAYVGFNGGMLTGSLAIYQGVTALAQAVNLTNRASYGSVGEAVFMSIDDMRNYAATNFPITWTMSSGTSNNVLNQYIELVPR